MATGIADEKTIIYIRAVSRNLKDIIQFKPLLIMINSIKLSHLRNNELLEFFQAIITRCSGENTDELQISELVHNLETENNKLSEVYNKEQGSLVTELLAESDARRDSDFTGLRTIIEGHTYSRDTAVSDAAKRLLTSINHQGNGIARMNYPAQTVAIDTLVKKWKSDEQLTQALNVLSLTPMAETLENENNRFRTIYQERVDDKMKNEGESFSDLRFGAIAAYNSLRETISAYLVITKSEDYRQLTNALNVIVDDYSAIIARRESNKEELSTD